MGSAFSFDGSASYVQISDAPSLRPASFTVETWLGVQSLTAGRTVASKAVSPNYHTWKLSQAGNVLTAEVKTPSEPSGAAISATFSPAVGRWFHVALTYDDATSLLSLYLDGRAGREPDRDRPARV